MYALGHISRSTAKTIFRTVKYQDIAGSNERYFESNPYYLNLLDILLELFPGSQVVLVIRSPISYVRSHVTWEYQRLRSQLANRLIPYWQPVAYSESLRGLRPSMAQRVQYYSDVWSTKNKWAAHLANGSERVHAVRYEDLFDPESGIAQFEYLARWLNLSLTRLPSRADFHRPDNQSVRTGKAIWSTRCEAIVRETCERDWDDMQAMFRRDRVGTG
jgi:hypothetical protein